jgi:hypothetical protein
MYLLIIHLKQLCTFSRNEKNGVTEGSSLGSSGIIFSEDPPFLALYFYLDCIVAEASKRSSIQGILNNSGCEFWVQCELYIALE